MVLRTRPDGPERGESGAWLNSIAKLLRTSPFITRLHRDRPRLISRGRPMLITPLAPESAGPISIPRYSLKVHPSLSIHCIRREIFLVSHKIASSPILNVRCTTHGIKNTKLHLIEHQCFNKTARNCLVLI